MSQWREAMWENSMETPSEGVDMYKTFLTRDWHQTEKTFGDVL